MGKAVDIASENHAAADAFASGGGGFAGKTVAGERRPFILCRGPWWIVLIAVGLTTIAAGILLPLREANRGLAHELAEVERERGYVDAQIEANRAFLRQIQEDPALLERVRMRMTNRPVAGTKFLDGADADRKFGSSPYAMTQVAAPPAVEPYHTDLPAPAARLFIDGKPRLVMLASGAAMLAAALLLGGSRSRLEGVTP